MKKLGIALLSIIIICGCIWFFLLPIGPSHSLQKQFELVQSDQFFTLCDKVDINPIQLLQQEFAKEGIEIEEGDASILLNTIRSFDYEITGYEIVGSYAYVEVKIQSVAIANVVKDKIRENRKEIILAYLLKNEEYFQSMIHEIIVELPSAPKDYKETIRVRVDEYKHLGYIFNIDNNSDFFNAICGNLLEELDMIIEISE